MFGFSPIASLPIAGLPAAASTAKKAVGGPTRGLGWRENDDEMMEIILLLASAEVLT